MHLTLNPLGDNLFLAVGRDRAGDPFGVIQALVIVNGVLQKRELLPTYITRKIIHIFAATLFW
ncbi:MAG: hypothetical protein R2856_03610 [Caldilineaceae bacterium]